MNVLKKPPHRTASTPRSLQPRHFSVCAFILSLFSGGLRCMCVCLCCMNRAQRKEERADANVNRGGLRRGRIWSGNVDTHTHKHRHKSTDNDRLIGIHTVQQTLMHSTHNLSTPASVSLTHQHLVWTLAPSSEQRSSSTPELV